MNSSEQLKLTYLYALEIDIRRSESQRAYQYAHVLMEKGFYDDIFRVLIRSTIHDHGATLTLPLFIFSMITQAKRPTSTVQDKRRAIFSSIYGLCAAPKSRVLVHVLDVARQHLFHFFVLKQCGLH